MKSHALLDSGGSQAPLLAPLSPACSCLAAHPLAPPLLPRHPLPSGLPPCCPATHLPPGWAAGTEARWLGEAEAAEARALPPALRAPLPPGWEAGLLRRRSAASVASMRWGERRGRAGSEFVAGNRPMSWRRGAAPSPLPCCCFATDMQHFQKAPPPRAWRSRGPAPPAPRPGSASPPAGARAEGARTGGQAGQCDSGTGRRAPAGAAAAQARRCGRLPGEQH